MVIKSEINEENQILECLGTFIKSGEYDIINYDFLHQISL